MDQAKELFQSIQKAAGELPVGFSVRICIEFHGYGVDLVDPKGVVHQLDALGITGGIREGLDKAKKLSISNNNKKAPN